tara:strand:+ start:689 stop:2017 length:1329 start_codon:yes stop_codon:yes gene_type:complete
MKQFTLPNGIRCLLNDTDCLESVSIVIMFRVGSRDEPPDFYGLTHFAEHMFFKGTKKRPKARMIADDIERYGGHLNAATDYDVTYYYVKIDKRGFEMGLDVLSDLLFNALFRQEDINKEKEVVVNELRMYDNNPQRLNHKLFNEMLFRGTTMEHDIGGDVDIIRGATREQFLTFVSHFYNPKNTVVSIAGQLPKNAQSLVKKYFNHKFNYINKINRNSNSSNKNKNNNTKNGKKLHKLGERPLFPDFPTLQTECRYRNRIKPNVDGSYILIGFPAMPLYSTDWWTAQVLACILGKGMSSRLFVEVREKRGLAYQIKCWTRCFGDMGSFVISSTTKTSDIKQAFKIIWKELEKIKKGDIKKSEIEKAQDKLIGEAHLQRESSTFLAQDAGYDLITINRFVTIKEFEKSIKNVTPTKIKCLALKLFKKKKLNVSVVSNKEVKIN